MKKTTHFVTFPAYGHSVSLRWGCAGVIVTFNIWLLLTCVGVMVFTSSEARLFSRVVLPALSSPRSTILTSCSVDPLSFSMTESKPCTEAEVGQGEEQGKHRTRRTICGLLRYLGNILILCWNQEATWQVIKCFNFVMLEVRIQKHRNGLVIRKMWLRCWSEWNQTPDCIYWTNHYITMR